MSEKIKGAEMQGDKIIALLSKPTNLQPTIYYNRRLTAEDGKVATWETFVTFPPELAEVFPGSYVAPNTFLREFGLTGIYVQQQQAELVGSRLGSVETPTLQLEQGDNKPSTHFSLTVLNGLTNSHALAMTKFAKLGFDDAFNRVQYQDNMFSSVKSLISAKPPNYGIKIFDDCIASGDSIAGYLYKLITEEDPRLKQGVVVTAVTATAQSILFLRRFAQVNGINLTIKVGQLAFGLTEGKKKENGVREHANYITYPPELLALLAEEISQELRRYQNEEGIIQVVGDMGEAEKGLSRKQMAQIQNELGNPDLCWWNDMRGDFHGDHPNRNTLLVPPLLGEKPLALYLARGGFLPYIWDEKLCPDFANVDKEIIRASRLWTKEHGYGVGIKKDGLKN